MPSDSVWLDELDAAGGIDECKILPEHADIVIVGAGMTGASLAWCLSREGKSCLVLEGREVSGGATGRNAGMLWPDPQCDFEMRTTQRLYEFIKSLDGGNESVLLDNKGGISLVGLEDEHEEEELLPNIEQIDPEVMLHAAPGHFHRGYYTHYIDTIHTVHTIHTTHNIHTIHTIHPGYYDKNPSTFYPAKVARALLKASQCAGGTYMRNCIVSSIVPCSNEDTFSSSATSAAARQVLHTSLGTITATDVIIATNAWIPELLPELSGKIKMVSNTVLCSRNAIPEQLRWSVSGVSCGHGAAEVYMNIRQDHRIVIGGLRERETIKCSPSLLPSNPPLPLTSNTTDTTTIAADVSPIPCPPCPPFLQGDETHDTQIAAALIQWFVDKFPAIAACIDFDKAHRWKGI